MPENADAASGTISNIKNIKANSLSVGKNAFEKLTPAPKIHYRFFLGSHQTAKDAEQIQRQLETADIYVPELVGWDSQALDVYQNISHGKLTVEEAEKELDLEGDIFETFHKRELELLHNSNKAITFVDFPEEIFEADEKNFTREPQSANPTDPFRRDLEEYKTRVKHLVDQSERREEYIKAQLPKKVAELVKETPELQKKSDVNVFLFLGAAHLPIARYFIESYPNASKQFQTMPFIYDIISEGLRRMKFGKEIDDTFAARMLLAQEIDVFFGKSLLAKLGSDKTGKLVRAIVTQFDYDEIKLMHVENREVDENRYFARNWSDIIRSHLADKKVQLPEGVVSILELDQAA